MTLARVVASVVSTEKHPQYKGYKILAVQPVDAEDKPKGEAFPGAGRRSGRHRGPGPRRGRGRFRAAGPGRRVLPHHPHGDLRHRGPRGSGRGGRRAPAQGGRSKDCGHGPKRCHRLGSRRLQAEGGRQGSTSRPWATAWWTWGLTARIPSTIPDIAVAVCRRVTTRRLRARHPPGRGRHRLLHGRQQGPRHPRRHVLRPEDRGQ